ncbi:hypothetical protein CYLTODRAFT_489514, partial [Cylindrobasidium torrendii FP15055 ss-10]
MIPLDEDPNSPPVTYARCLASMLGGFPFFEPRSIQLRSLRNFRKTGASYPYDLSYIGQRSLLSYIYSVGSHEAHPRNLDDDKNGLAPPWHEPYMNGLALYTPFEKPGDDTIMTSGWSLTRTQSAVAGGVSLGETRFDLNTKFICETHGTTGALLTTPGDNNIEYNIEDSSAITNYIKANSIAWFEFCNGQRMLNAAHGNLYLLTYVAKTAQFENAVYVGNEKSRVKEFSSTLSVFGLGAAVGGGKTKADGKTGAKLNSAETSNHAWMVTAAQGWMVRLVHWRLFLRDTGVSVEAQADAPTYSMAPSDGLETIRIPFKSDAATTVIRAPPSRPFPGSSSKNDGDRFWDGSDSEEEDGNGGGGSGSPPPDGRHSSSGGGGISALWKRSRKPNVTAINTLAGGGPNDEGGSGRREAVRAHEQQLNDYRSRHALRRAAGRGPSSRTAAARQEAVDALASMENNLPRVVDPCALLGYAPTRSVHLIHDDRPYHPLYEIMDSMSESAPWARFSLAHDQDYLSVLKKGEVVPLGKELVSRVAKKYVVEVDKDGFACLIDREKHQLVDDQLGFVLNMYRKATDVDTGFDVVRTSNIPSTYVLFPPVHGGHLDLLWTQLTPRAVDLRTAQQHNRTQFYEILHAFCIEHAYTDPSRGYCFIRPDREDTNYDYISGSWQWAIWESMGQPPQDETAEINLAADMSGLTMSSAAQARADEEERKKRKKVKKAKVIVLRE